MDNDSESISQSNELKKTRLMSQEETTSSPSLMMKLMQVLDNLPSQGSCLPDDYSRIEDKRNEMYFSSSDMDTVLDNKPPQKRKCKQSIKSRKKKRSTSKQKSRRNGIVKIEITDSPVEEDDTFEIDLNAYEVESGDLHGGYKEKYFALRAKYLELKRKYHELTDESSPHKLVELVPGSHLKMKKSELERLKTISKQPTNFARNLFRHFFTFEELSTHSLFGVKCNANRDTPVLPAIDSVKRDTIMQFIFNDAGYDDDKCFNNKELQARKKSLKREVTKTLSDFLREEHRKV